MGDHLDDGGWRTSDEILDAARDGLRFFADFVPVYDQAAQLAGRGRYRGINLADDIHQPYDQARGIDFGMMRADADHLRSAIDAAEDHRTNLHRYWSGLAGWHGTAADAARTQRDLLDGEAAGFLRAAGSAPGTIAAGVSAIERKLVEYSGHIIELNHGRCGAMTVAEVREAIRFAVDDESARAALGDMVDEFDATMHAFEAHTRNLRQGIERDYDTMLAGLRPLNDEAFTTAATMPEPKPVMIGLGESTLTVSSANGQGTLRLTVADAAGVPRTYELDFGQQLTAPSDATGPSGADGTVPPTPPATSSAATTSDHHPHAGTGGQPRLPATLFSWGRKPVERLRADDDGKVVIRDGEVTITVAAEVADELTITLDDGNGHQTVYTVDYDDPAHPTLRAEGDLTGVRRRP